MSIDYLEDLEKAVNVGKEFFVCPGAQASEWILSSDVESLSLKAQRTANALKFQCHIYRLINSGDVITGDSYLVVRKILEPLTNGQPRYQWGIVDTKEAAEMMRDVSQGPSPYFGATIEKSFSPEKAV